MHIYTYTRICAHLQFYVFIPTYMHMCNFTYVYMCTYVCKHTHTFLVLKIFADLNSNTENKTRFVSGPRNISEVIQMPLRWNNGDIW